jgi:hypothetical protein
MLPRSASIAIEKLHQNVRMVHTGFSGVRAPRIALLAAILLAGTSQVACDESDTPEEFRDFGRVPIVEIDCDASGCLGRWENSFAWSPIYPWQSVLALRWTNPDSVWRCDPDPDVDLCVVIDAQNHKACFRYEWGYAVKVAPTCAVSGGNWLSVGNGRVALATAFYFTGCEPGSLGCPCVNSTCGFGLVCAEAENGNNVCSVTAPQNPCDHSLGLDYDGIPYDGACVAECTQFVDHCGPMECSPKDAFAQGFCAWPE